MLSRPRAGELVLWLVLSGLAALVAWGFWGYSYDDAFISYRYARNWAEHGELAYNLGEPVLGTTAPGYALLLGALSALTGIGVPGWGTLLGVGSIAAAAFVLSRILVDTSPAFRRGAPLLFAGAAFLLRWNVEMLGAETFPVLALAAAAVYLGLERGREGLAGLLLALAMSFRLDAALLALVLGLALWWRRRRFPWRFALAGLVPLALFLAWLTAEFGTFLPATMAAKQSELATGSYGYALAEWRWLRRGLPISGCLLLIGLALWALGEGIAAARRRPFPGQAAALVLVAWILLHEIAYRLLAVPFAPWYHLGLIHGLLAAAVLGALLLGSRLAARFSSLRARAFWQTGLAGVLLLPLLLPSLRYTAGQLGRPPDPRWPGYVAVARHVAGEAPPGATLAAVEIGFLGYFSEARVLDLMGLVSPEVLAARQSGGLPRLIAARQPDYLVEVSSFRDAVLSPILAEPGVRERYGSVLELSTGPPPSPRIHLLRRREGP